MRTHLLYSVFHDADFLAYKNDALMPHVDDDDGGGGDVDDDDDDDDDGGGEASGSKRQRVE